MTKAVEMRKAAARLQSEHGECYKVTAIYDRAEIARLLSEGKSLGETARLVGCSRWPVQVVRKQMKAEGLCF